MARLLSLIPAALVALIFGFLGAWAFTLSGLGGNATREWLLAHPEILPEMAEAYQANEARARLAGVAGGACFQNGRNYAETGSWRTAGRI